MKNILLLLLFPIITWSQTTSEEKSKTELERYDSNKFSQMYDLLATPNMFRTASGAPGPAYYQQQADYKIDIELDDKNSKLTGSETLTYYNNSPDTLDYLWIQLDQNQAAKNSQTPLAENQRTEEVFTPNKFANKFLKQGLERGFNIEYVKDLKGKSLPYSINYTMMRIDLPAPLKSGEKISLSIKWWYNNNNYRQDG